MSESDFERTQYELRREKRREIARLGVEAGAPSLAEATYPNHYRATHTIPELRTQYGDLTAEDLEARNADPARQIVVSLAGRVMAIRVQGKAGFAQLQQGGQRFQIYVRRDDVGETLFALYKLLDLGDHIGVRGFLFRTRTGELTVHVRTAGDEPALTFLTKSMLALPDKYHGLEDTELRYRQRYVDLIMNSGATPKPVAIPSADGEAEADEALNVREVFEKRAKILRAIRKFFDDRQYIEVETPMLVGIAGGAAARPFLTHHNALDLGLSLRIAPELYLKRLVVGGLDRVYEINRNFRNEGIDTSHNPEFTMLEFYQAYSNYHDLMDLTQELVTFVATEVNGTSLTQFDGHEIDLSKWTRLSMREAIIKFWPEDFGLPPSLSMFETAGELEGFLLHSLQHLQSRYPEISIPTAEVQGVDLERHRRLRSLVVLINAQRILLRGDFNEIAASVADILGFGRPTSPMPVSHQSLGKTIAEIFEAVAEPHLIQPTIIYDFPLAVSPLSKQKPDEPEWVERFEFYIGGFEVGNAFSELNDPDEQRRRFEDQLKERERGDDEAQPMDEDYVRALGYGLPPTAGEGVGIDRLTMLLTGSKSIRDVILFPLMRPVVKAEQEAQNPRPEAVPSPS